MASGKPWEAGHVCYLPGIYVCIWVQHLYVYGYIGTPWEAGHVCYLPGIYIHVCIFGYI